MFGTSRATIRRSSDIAISLVLGRHAAGTGALSREGASPLGRKAPHPRSIWAKMKGAACRFRPLTADAQTPTLGKTKVQRMEINVSFDRPEDGPKAGPVTVGGVLTSDKGAVLYDPPERLFFRQDRESGV